MNPTFQIDGMDVVLHPLDMVSVSLEQLGDQISSLAEHGQRITDALDELLTRSWGAGLDERSLCTVGQRVESRLWCGRGADS